MEFYRGERLRYCLNDTPAWKKLSKLILTGKEEMNGKTRHCSKKRKHEEHDDDDEEEEEESIAPVLPQQ